MKKTIAVILAVVIALAAGVGIGYKVFVFKAEKDKTKKVYDEEIQVTFSDVTIGESIFYSIDKNKSRWSDSLVNVYGMSEKQRDSLINTPENWLAFNLFVDVLNPNDKQILVGNIEVPDNGKNGLFFQSVLDGQHVLEKNVSAQLPIYVFLDDNNPSLDEVTDMIKGMDIYIKYVPMPDDIEEEIPEESYQTAKVEF
jgi:hypothetical protein